MTGRTIVIFTRSPAAEARAKRLPAGPGTALFESFLSAWRRTADEAGADFLVVAPRDSVASLQETLPDVDIETQPDDRFDVKLNAAFDVAFRLGASAALIVGGDSPPIEPTEIRRAFDHLESHERALFLAPADDGGVNAIGLTPTTPRMFGAVNWRTAAVHRHLRACADQLGVTILDTDSSPDLDASGAIRSLYRRSVVAPLWRAYRWLVRALIPLVPAAATHVAPLPSLLLCSARTTRGPPFAHLCS
ncbi:MAG: DUF2064 domain-containing protein [Luteitalea sp.]|nr:DUF2064 domain-containing protein [Luteitalea sp.]